MNKIAFLLHLYQPPFQTADVLHRVASECYIPLINLLKKYKSFKLTLNTPLSLLELMDRNGYSDWIEEIKTLHSQGQIELVGSGAYHPLLTKIPIEAAEIQIVLNEAGLAYFLGRRKNFNGEDELLISNITGFFPPELAFNSELLHKLNELDYEYVVVDKTALNNKIDNDIVQDTFTGLHLVVRNESLSNELAFKRNSDLPESLVSSKDLQIIIVDGETFGHHNKQGVILLEKIIQNNSHFHLIGELNATKKEKISIKESTWGKGKDEDNPYMLWLQQNNAKQHEIYDKIVKSAKSAIDINASLKMSYSLPDNLNKYFNNKNTLYNEEALNIIRQLINSSKRMTSDPLWWSSGAEMPDGAVLNSESAVEMYNKL